MKETLTERMRHAAAHCEGMYDLIDEAKALCEGAEEIERLRRYIDALHGKGDIRHCYNGLCPDQTQPDSRDDECPACLLLTPNA